jgi:uncharacterized Zn finger protein
MRRFEDGFPGKPIKVEGGIKARSARGRIGDTWWSKKFLGSLEALADPGRLQRGRSYARAGQVRSLTIEPGLVSAAVQGSRKEPYAVSLAFAAVPSATWDRIVHNLASQARYAAHLLAGDVPHDLVSLFEAEGSPLFPVRPTDLQLECTCPDWGWPCKHVAATCYLLAEAFDEDPFALLKWRGLDRTALLDRVRELRDGSSAAAPPAVVDAGPVVGTAAALAPSSVGFDASQWFVSPVPLPDQPPVGRSDVVVVRQLPPPPAHLGGEDLARELADLYRRLAAAPLDADR